MRSGGDSDFGSAMASSGKARHGHSSSQASLAKIMRTILTFRPCGAIGEVALGAKLGEGLGIDLKLRLGHSPESEDSDVVLIGDGGPSASGTAETPPPAENGLCDGEWEAKREEQTEGESHGRESAERGEKPPAEASQELRSEIGSGEAEEKEEEGGDGGAKAASFWREEEEGGLRLLVEAARVVSGGFGEAEAARRGELSQGLEGGRARSGSRKREKWWMLYGEGVELWEDTSPVVRSKRGRSQVLPCRFRDSVLEPWKAPPRARPNPVPTKRRSRR